MIVSPRSKLRMAPLVPFLLLGMIALVSAPGEAQAAESILDHLVKPSLNVVITVTDMEAAQEFYGEVLGLEPMGPLFFRSR